MKSFLCFSPISYPAVKNCCIRHQVWFICFLLTSAVTTTVPSGFASEHAHSADPVPAVSDWFFHKKCDSKEIKLLWDKVFIPGRWIACKSKQLQSLKVCTSWHVSLSFLPHWKLNIGFCCVFFGIRDIYLNTCLGILNEIHRRWDIRNAALNWTHPVIFLKRNLKCQFTQSGESNPILGSN